MAVHLHDLFFCCINVSPVTDLLLRHPVFSLCK